MEALTVKGGAPLYGSVAVGGSKNAALPLLFATMLTRGVSTLTHVPDIADVHVTLAILSAYGAVIERTDADTYRINTENLTYITPPAELVDRIRASTYLLGASVARFGRAVLQPFGGCAFSARPIDMHLGVIRTLGGRIEQGRITAATLHAGHVVFPKISVGATVNALFLAVAADGVTVLENVAVEPHIGALIAYLTAAGADITAADGRITVRGGYALHGAHATVIPDMIEAGTYLLCGPMTGGRVCVQGIDPTHLLSLTSLLCSAGCHVEQTADSLTAWATSPLAFMSVTAAPYPAFPTDLQPPLSALMAAHGGGEILDTVFPERYGYRSALAPFGVRSELHAPLLRLYPSRIVAGTSAAPDLRGGAAALLCALRAEGESTVERASLLLRGYERLTEKLSSLGANVSLHIGK